jgi:WD40 repeat protein
MSTSIPPNVAGKSRSPIARTFGHSRYRTEGDVIALAFDSNNHLWSVEQPGVLRSWDDQGCSTGRHFLLDLETVWAFSPKAKLLAAACDELMVWEVATRQMLARLEVPSWVTAIAFHPSLLLVATGHDDGVVRLWNPAEEALIAEFSEHELPVSALAFDADGGRLVSAGEDRVLKLWDVGDRKLIRDFTGHTDRIPAVGWHPSGQYVVSVGWDTTARVWDAATGEPKILLNSHDDQVQQLAFAADGRLLATSDSASTIHVWDDLLSGKSLHKIHSLADEITALAFSNDGQRLAVGGTDRAIHIYDARTGAVLGGQTGEVRHGVALWKDGGRQYAVSNASDRGLLLWDLESGADRASPLPVGQYLHVAASADGRWLAGVMPNTQIHLWDAVNKSQKVLDGPKTAPSFLEFTPDGQFLTAALTNEGTVWLWSLATFEPALLVVEATEGCSVEAIAWHPNAKWLLCGGVDFLSTSGSTGAVCLWDVPDRKRLVSIPHGATCLAMDSAAKVFAFGTPDGWVQLHAIETGDPIMELEGPEEECVDALAFNDAGNWLIGAGNDGLMRVWDTATGDLLAARELPACVDRMIRLPNDRLLAALENGTVAEILISALVNEP